MRRMLTFALPPMVWLVAACSGRVDESPTVKKPTCVASCGARTCGDDGCGGTCGTCGSGVCGNAGTCENEGEVMVPTRDGVELSTYVMMPKKAGKFPTLLLRSPNAFQRDGTITRFRPMIDQGYAFVYQSVRGTGASRGALKPLAQEFPDGQDTVSWITQQPWSDGKVATIGTSYEGFAALAAAVDSPAVVGVIAEGYVTDSFQSWPLTHGGIASGDLLAWLGLVRGQSLEPERFLSISTNHRPFRDLDRALLGKEDMTWRGLVRDPGARDPAWDASSLVGKFDRVCAPVLHVIPKGESKDDALRGFVEMDRKACSETSRGGTKFMLSDRVEGVYDLFGQSEVARLGRNFLETYLKGRSVLAETPRVQVFVEGSNTWATGSSWPLATGNRDFFLAGGSQGGALSTTASAIPNAATYTFDPDRDDACQNKMEGAAFLTTPLEESIRIVGAPTADLSVSIDTPDADLVAYLYEILSDGSMRPFTSTRLRLRFRDSFADPKPMVKDTPTRVHLEFNTVGYELPLGARLMLYVVSSECGGSENPNTGGSVGDTTGTRKVTVRLHEGGDGASRISLPTFAPEK
jgi:uncharacterized protein